MNRTNLSAKPTKAPEKPPLFAKGDHVTVHPHSELAYETFTRKGAVGVIMRVGVPVRGIRRYQVLFEVPHLGGRRASSIREEHLLKAEPPAPRQYATARHAYEYRDQHPSDHHLWCDAGGSFIEDCAVCRAHEGDTLTTTTTVTFACARGRGVVTCNHAWQVWPDGRYRHCPKCKLSERVERVVRDE